MIISFVIKHIILFIFNDFRLFCDAFSGRFFSFLAFFHGSKTMRNRA